MLVKDNRKQNNNFSFERWRADKIIPFPLRQKKYDQNSITSIKDSNLPDTHAVGSRESGVGGYAVQNSLCRGKITG